MSGDGSRLEDLRAVWAASELARAEPLEAFAARFSASVGLPDAFDYGALTAAAHVPGYVPDDLDALFPFWALEDVRRELRASSRLRRFLDDPAAVNAGKPSELVAAVCAGFGVERASIATFDARQNRAWFVAAFLILHARAFGDPPEVAGGSAEERAAFAREAQAVALFNLGRLCEWWRWRTPLIDPELGKRKRSLEEMALLKRQTLKYHSEEGGAIAEHNKKKSQAAQQWKREAAALAERMRAAKPAASAAELAPRILKELTGRGFTKADGAPLSEGAVRKAIPPRRR